MDNVIRQKLIDLAEEQYRKFSSGLIPNADNMLGVRLPLLHKMAGEIARGDWRSYLASADTDGEYFEEIMLQGMVIGYAKTDVEEKLCHVAWFVPKIDNWSVCDSFCTNLKFTNNNKQRVWVFLQPYIVSVKEYEARFGVIMLLIYYVDDEHIGQVLQLLDKVRHEGYYAKMAVAWAVSICFAKFPETTMQYLKYNSLDDFTYNKALQKIIESHQVNKEIKDLIGSMKRRT